jgi:ribosome-binding factor A
MSRSDKVAEEIKREVSQIVQEEIRDPRLGFVTITRVELTPDLRFARIFFSVYGNADQWKDTEVVLKNACGFVRRLVGDRMGLRFVPEIVFTPDHSSEYSIVIEQQLEQIRLEKEVFLKAKKEVKRGPKKTVKRAARKKT